MSSSAVMTGCGTMAGQRRFRPVAASSGLVGLVACRRRAGSVACRPCPTRKLPKLGVVLVDSTHEDTTLMYKGKIVRVREGASGKPVPPVQTMETSPPAPPSAEDK